MVKARRNKAPRLLGRVGKCQRQAGGGGVDQNGDVVLGVGKRAAVHALSRLTQLRTAREVETSPHSTAVSVLRQPRLDATRETQMTGAGARVCFVGVRWWRDSGGTHKLGLGRESGADGGCQSVERMDSDGTRVKVPTAGHDGDAQL